MIARIRQRREFQTLSRHGRRLRTDALWCRYEDDPAVVPPRVGFAIGRGVGSAVARNRLRRRLRAIVAAMARDGGFDHGRLLLGARREALELAFVELRDEVSALVGAARSST